jgi:hypothetical protein
MTIVKNVQGRTRNFLEKFRQLFYPKHRQLNIDYVEGKQPYILAEKERGTNMDEIVVEQTQRGYLIRFEEEHSLLYNRLYGFFDADFEWQYHNDFFTFLEKIQKPQIYVLADTTAYPPQSKAVQEIRHQIIHKLPDYNVVKLAYIVEKALSRLQSERLTRDKPELQVAFFESEAEARAWLLG